MARLSCTGALTAAVLAIATPSTASASLILRESFDVTYPAGQTYVTDLNYKVSEPQRQYGLSSAATTANTLYWSSNSANTRLSASGPYAKGVQLSPSAAEPCVDIHSELDLSRQRSLRVSVDTAMTELQSGSWVGLVVGRDRGGFVTSPDHVGLYVNNQKAWVFCYNGQCDSMSSPGALSGNSHRLTLEIQQEGGSYIASAWVDDEPAVMGRTLHAGLSNRNVTVYTCGAGETTSLDDLVISGVPDRSAVGALRWDAWFESKVNTPALYDFTWWLRTLDSGYPDRIPFWAVKLGENDYYFDNTSLSSVDQEIRYAATALDYWTFLYYSEHDPKHDNLNYGWRNYRDSASRDDIPYALMLGGTVFCNDCLHEDGSVASPAWSVSLPEIVAAMRSSSYYRVLGARPALYVFDDANVDRIKLDQLRAAIQADGLGEAYVIGLTWWSANYAAMGAKGYDAISSYSSHSKNYHEQNGFDPTKSRTYYGLTVSNHDYWRNFIQGTSLNVVPNANVGWNCLPRVPTNAYLCDAAYDGTSAGDIGGHVLSMLNWADLNRGRNPARTSLLYAWNEFDEGGWLAPTLSEGTARVDRLSEGLDGKVWLRDSFNLQAFEQSQGSPGIGDTFDLNLEQGIAHTGLAPTRHIGVRGASATATWASNRSAPYRVQLRRQTYGDFTGAMAIYPDTQQSCVNASLNENLQALPNFLLSLDVSASKVDPASWIGVVVGPTAGAFVDAPGHAAFYLQNNGASYYWLDGAVKSIEAAASHAGDVHHLALRSQRSGSGHTLRVTVDGKPAVLDTQAASVTPAYVTVWACGAGEAFGIDSLSVLRPW